MDEQTIGIKAQLTSITINRADGTTEHIEIEKSEEEDGNNNSNNK